MATTTLNIPDPILPGVLDDFAAAKGYNPATDGTKAQFLKSQMIQFVKNIVVEYRANAAANTAAASARTTATTDIAIT